MIMVVSVFAFAQRGNGNSEVKMQKTMDRMTEQLDLSADQQAEVKELLTAQQSNRKSLGKKGADMTEADKAAHKEARKAQRDDFETKLSAILTPAQQETYKTMSKGKGKKGKGKGNKKGGQKSAAEKAQKKVAKMTEELNLTPTQQAEMTELMATRPTGNKKDKEAMKAMSEEDRAAMKAAHKAEKEAFGAKMEAILTPEQLATYKEMEAEHKGKKKAKKQDKKGLERRVIEQ